MNGALISLLQELFLIQRLPTTSNNLTAECFGAMRFVILPLHFYFISSTIMAVKGERHKYFGHSYDFKLDLLFYITFTFSDLMGWPRCGSLCVQQTQWCTSKFPFLCSLVFNVGPQIFLVGFLNSSVLEDRFEGLHHLRSLWNKGYQNSHYSSD